MDRSDPRRCAYCTSGRLATHVVHDRRGCTRVCATHADWRRTTSVLVGHDKDCCGKAAVWRHVTPIEELS